MTFKRFFDDDSAIRPDELGVLQSVFNEICRIRHLDPRSDVARDVATTIVGIYQAGFRGYDELLHMVSANDFIVDDFPISDANDVG